jgi:hypothetical protein
VLPGGRAALFEVLREQTTLLRGSQGHDVAVVDLVIVPRWVEEMKARLGEVRIWTANLGEPEPSPYAMRRARWTAAGARSMTSRGSGREPRS